MEAPNSRLMLFGGFQMANAEASLSVSQREDRRKRVHIRHTVNMQSNAVWIKRRHPRWTYYSDV